MAIESLDVPFIDDFFSSGFFPSNLKKSTSLWGFIKMKDPQVTMAFNTKYPHDFGKFRVLDLGNLSLLHFGGEKIHSPAILGYHPGTAHVLPLRCPLRTHRATSRTSAAPPVHWGVSPRRLWPERSNLCRSVRLQRAQPKAGGTYHKPLVI